MKDTMKDTMKTQKSLWIALIAFGLFAIIFCRWVYVKDTVRENLSFNETVHLETSQAFENEVPQFLPGLRSDYEILFSVRSV